MIGSKPSSISQWINLAFGCSVSLDGERAAIGAMTYIFPSRGGAVFIFRRGLGGADVWGLEQAVVALDFAKLNYSQFGNRISLQNGMLTVGGAEAAGEEGGQVVLYRLGLRPHWSFLPFVSRQ